VSAAGAAALTIVVGVTVGLVISVALELHRRCQRRGRR
jgi:hypothetical protein